MPVAVKPSRKELNTISTKHDCLRKLLHTDYLSAIRHAAQIPHNDSVVIYPCSGCGEGEKIHLHVGHSTTDPIWALKLRIARTERRLLRSAELLREAEIACENGEQLQQSITDRRNHLKRLRTDLAAMTTSESC
jgi:hypothetical protein